MKGKPNEAFVLFVGSISEQVEPSWARLRKDQDGHFVPSKQLPA